MSVLPLALGFSDHGVDGPDRLNIFVDLPQRDRVVLDAKLHQFGKAFAGLTGSVDRFSVVERTQEQLEFNRDQIPGAKVVFGGLLVLLAGLVGYLPVLIERSILFVEVLTNIGDAASKKVTPILKPPPGERESA